MAQNVVPPKSFQMKILQGVSCNDVVETSWNFFFFFFFSLFSISNLAIYRFIPVQCIKIMLLFYYYFIVVFKVSLKLVPLSFQLRCKLLNTHSWTIKLRQFEIR